MIVNSQSRPKSNLFQATLWLLFILQQGDALDREHPADEIWQLKPTDPSIRSWRTSRSWRHPRRCPKNRWRGWLHYKSPAWRADLIWFGACTIQPRALDSWHQNKDCYPLQVSMTKESKEDPSCSTRCLSGRRHSQKSCIDAYWTYGPQGRQ